MPSWEMCLDDAHGYLERIIASLHALDRREKGPLIAVLEHLSRYVQSTKKDIAELRNAEGSRHSFSTAADELEEIVAESAKATHAIMTATETMEKLGATMDKDSAATLNDAVTKIYESCAFQDITGQRIAKVIATLQRIETKVVALARAVGGEIESNGEEETAERDHLLNGPQLAVNAASQEEIDRIFEGI